MSLMEEVGRFTKEDFAEFEQAEAESRVVVKGTYEGTIVSWNEIPEETKGMNDAYRGYPVFRAGVRCYDYPDVGKSQIAWVKISGVKVMNEGGRLKAPSSAGLQLTKAMMMPGSSITDVLDQAKATRAKYMIEVWEKDNPDDPTKKIPGGNWCKGVKAL